MKELLDVIQESDDLAPGQVEQFYSFAYAQYQAGHPAKAAEVFQVLCLRRPFDFRFWFGFGASLQEEKKYEEALHAWAMAALLDKPNPFPHFHAAECSFSIQNKVDGVLALKEAETRIDQNHPLQARISILKETWNL